MPQDPSTAPGPVDVLTLQEAADALKVHYMTAYRWVRRGDLPAFKAGGRIRVRAADLEGFVRDRAVETALPSGSGRTEWALHVERLHGLLRAGATADATALTRKVIADGAPVGDVYIRLMAPALHGIGEDWARGEISVAEEHRATEIVASMVARLGDHFRRRGPARGTAVTLTPPGDQHGLASSMVADFLRGAGLDVHHLGAAVPGDELARFLAMVAVDAVCISVTRTDLPEDAVSEVVRAGRDAGRALVVVGGQGADAPLAERLGAVHLQDLAQLPALVAGSGAG